MTAIRVEGLCKRYPQFQLKDVSLEVPRGSIVGFIGENGAGKTTTIKAIIGAIRTDGGQVEVFGQNFAKHGTAIKQHLAVVTEESFFYEEFAAKDIARVMRRIYARWDDELFRHYLGRFKLPHDKRIKELSKGMRMKLSIAAALSHRPKLLILDEPTSGLDPVVRSEILDIFLDFIQDEEHAILFSTHITTDLEKIADYIVFIHEGQIVFSRPKDELTEHYGIMKCGVHDFHRVDAADYVGYRKHDFGYEILVADRQAMQRKYPHLPIDHAAIEDIMLYHVRGDLR